MAVAFKDLKVNLNKGGGGGGDIPAKEDKGVIIFFMKFNSQFEDAFVFRNTSFLPGPVPRNDPAGGSRVAGRRARSPR